MVAYAMTAEVPGYHGHQNQQGRHRQEYLEAKLSFGKLLQDKSEDQRVLVAAATDSSTLGVLDAARQSGRARNITVIGQDGSDSK